VARAIATVPAQCLAEVGMVAPSQAAAAAAAKGAALGAAQGATACTPAALTPCACLDFIPAPNYL